MSLPEPLTHPYCDITDFKFMPLDVGRLRDSDTAALTSGDEFRCAVLLWCASWHQIPAASLPDDDKVLANLAGFGRVVKEWQKVRNGALSGWVKCSDGRLYHPVVAEKAKEAWHAKIKQRWLTECSRIKKHNQRHEDNPIPVPEFDAFLHAIMSQECPQGQSCIVPKDKTDMSSDSPQGNALQGTGTGTGIGTGNLNTKPTSSSDTSNVGSPAESPPPSPSPTRAGEIAALLRNKEAERKRQINLTSQDPRVQEWAKVGVTDELLLEALDMAVKSREARGDTKPINAGYLDCFLADLLNPANAKSAIVSGGIDGANFNGKPWWMSWSGIEAKGTELGLSQGENEHPQRFKARVIAEAGIGEDELRKAQVDYA